MIYLVEYEHLCKNPFKTMKGIYDFLEKNYFDHDFDNVEYENEVFDRALNMKDLHTVKRKVEWVERKMILPDFVIERYKNKNLEKNLFNYE
jgi:sulfotransferase